MGYETLLYLYKDDIINVWENKHIYLTNTNIDYCNINLFSRDFNTPYTVFVHRVLTER